MLQRTRQVQSDAEESRSWREMDAGRRGTVAEISTDKVSGQTGRQILGTARSRLKKAKVLMQ